MFEHLREGIAPPPAAGGDDEPLVVRCAHENPVLRAIGRQVGPGDEATPVLHLAGECLGDGSPVEDTRTRVR